MRRFLHRVWPALIGLLSALLLGRFVAKALAARPDNPFFALLYATTDWLRLPLLWLDAGQPQYGAVIEGSTLLMALLLLIIGGLGARWLQPWAERERPSQENHT